MCGVPPFVEEGNAGGERLKLASIVQKSQGRQRERVQ